MRQETNAAKAKNDQENAKWLGSLGSYVDEEFTSYELRKNLVVGEARANRIILAGIDAGLIIKTRKKTGKKATIYRLTTPNPEGLDGGEN